MNYYQEALITICECKGVDGIVSQVNSIQELINKATPKKPKEFAKRNYMFGSYKVEILGKCPNKNCNSYVFKDLNKFCSNCGQEIDWSNE